MVQGCERPITRAGGLCPGHYAWFHFEVRPAKVSLTDWLASGPAPVKSNNQPLSTCLVSWCQYGRESRGMCVRHAKARRVGGISDDGQRAWGALLPRDEVTIASACPCLLRECDLWARPSKKNCRSHDARMLNMQRRQGRDVGATEFQIWVDASGCLRLGVLHLPPRLKLEVQYAAQTYLERGTVRMQLMEWATPTHLLLRTGVESVLDKSPQEWLSLWKEYRPGRRQQAAFFTWAWEELDKLVHGTGWDVEYERDVWRTRRIMTTGDRRANLDFTGIEVDWLRALTKRYARQRISAGLSMAAVVVAVYALTDLSRFLHTRGFAMASPQELTREHLEQWLANVTSPPESDVLATPRPALSPSSGGWVRRRGVIGTSTQASWIGQVSMFLQEVQQRGWAPGLPSTTAIFKHDRPRNPKSTAPRAISEYLMTQMEAGLELMPDLTWRLITEIVMRTGLRSGDVLQIEFDCVIRDGDANPYLRYLSHKMSRTAYTPIDENLAKAIVAQQARGLAQFGRQVPWLFPAKLYNATGQKPATRGGWIGALARWLDAIHVADEHGLPVHFTPHQFRHTYATRLINNDVPHHIVQQLLDHTSAEMTSHYARAHSKTVRKAWSKARKINASGEPVDLPDDHPLSDVPWARAGLDQAKATLPNGYCGMPAQSPCEHANPCLTCPLFLTTPEFLPQHQAQHRTTLALIEVARTKGHQHVVDKNERIAHNLARIITACQSCEPDQVVAGGNVVTPGGTTTVAASASSAPGPGTHEASQPSHVVVPEGDRADVI